MTLNATHTDLTGKIDLVIGTSGGIGNTREGLAHSRPFVQTAAGSTRWIAKLNPGMCWVV